MISHQEAKDRLEQCRSTLGIPLDADLISLEKHLIELGDFGEIEAIAPNASSIEDVEVEAVAMEASPKDAAIRIPRFSNRLVWLGVFSQMLFTWELALDEKGILVRLRKSR